MKTNYLFLLVVIIMTFSACKSNDPYPIYNPPTTPKDTVHEVTCGFDFKTQHPLTAVFTNKSLFATSYLWDFGDGETSKEENPTHRYATKGVYKVSLTAKNTKYQKTASRNVTVENPTKIYISGVTINKIPHNNQYYYVKIIDDDVFTTTWAKTYSVLLSSANTPFDYMFVDPTYLSGLSEDNYYMMQLYYSTSSTGTGTKVAEFKMTKTQILQYPEKLTGTNDNASLTTHFSYK